MANKYYGTGRRKKSIARVYLVPGTGKITINKRDIDEYLGLETLKLIVRQPLVATETTDKFDVMVNVRGGGFSGQAGAIRHGISRALLQADADFRPVLKKAGDPTPEIRVSKRERKKYGLKGSSLRASSSARDNLLFKPYQNGSKSPENQGFPGFYYISKRADMVRPNLAKTRAVFT